MEVFLAHFDSPGCFFFNQYSFFLLLFHSAISAQAVPVSWQQHARQIRCEDLMVLGSFSAHSDICFNVQLQLCTLYLLLPSLNADRRRLYGATWRGVDLVFCQNYFKSRSTLLCFPVVIVVEFFIKERHGGLLC